MLTITQYQCHYMPLLIIVFCIYINVESIDDNQTFNSNDKKEDKIELGDIMFQKILKNQEVTYNKDYILIATILLYMLCYAKN